MNISKSKRSFMVALPAALGAMLYSTRASALPRRTAQLARQATRFLSLFGVRVDTDVDPGSGNEVLRFTIEAREDIQYEQVTNLPSAAGGDTCWIEKSFRDAVEFTHFDMAAGAPNLRVFADATSSLVEILDPHAVLRVSVAGGATYELRNGELVSTDLS